MHDTGPNGSLSGLKSPGSIFWLSPQVGHITGTISRTINSILFKKIPESNIFFIIKVNIEIVKSKKLQKENLNVLNFNSSLITSSYESVPEKACYSHWPDTPRNRGNITSKFTYFIKIYITNKSRFTFS